MQTIPEVYAMLGDCPSEEGSEISEVERLANEFEAHESQERMFLERYKELAAQSESRVVKFLLDMVVADEEKHHAITRAMTSTLRGDLNWTKPPDAINGLYELKGDKTKLLPLTEAFIAVEKEGINEYRALIKESKGYYRDLFGLLFHTMIRDSEKHVEILEFLRERLKEA